LERALFAPKARRLGSFWLGMSCTFLLERLIGMVLRVVLLWLTRLFLWGVSCWLLCLIWMFADEVTETSWREEVEQAEYDKAHEVAE
jgi:hypothetical protein